MLRDDAPIVRIARYVAGTRVAADLTVRLQPLKQSLAPHWSRTQDFFRETHASYERHCAPVLRTIGNFIHNQIEASKRLLGEQRQRLAQFNIRARLARTKASLAPYWSGTDSPIPQLLDLYEKHCAPFVRPTVNFIRRHIEASKQRKEERRLQAEAEAALQAENARILEEEMQAEADAAAIAAYDPEAAIEDMRLAHSYLEDWIEKKGDHVLGLAAQYIELARTKDANAKLSVEIKKGENKGEVFTYTLDDLAGRTLFYESQLHSISDAPKEFLEEARDLLKRAIAYVPYSVQYRRHLADVYLDLHDKQSALAVAQEALAVDPKNLDARKLFDHVRNAPETIPPSPLEGNGGMLIAALGGVLGILSIVQLFRLEFGSAFGFFIGAAILFGIARFIDSDNMLKKAMEHQARKNPRG